MPSPIVPIALIILLLAPPAPASAEADPLAPFQAAAERAGVVLALPEWEKRPADIERSLEQALAEANRRLDAIAAQTKPTLENTLVALDDAYDPPLLLIHRLEIIQNTHPDAELREAARQAIRKLEEWFVEASFRRDLYEAVRRYADTKPPLQGEPALLLKTLLRDYRRNGMMLPKEQRRRLEALKKRLNELAQDFHHNIKEADRWLTFDAEALEGVPKEFLDDPKIRTADGRYRINVNVTWQVLEVLRNARREATRKAVVTARAQRAMAENLPLFTRMLQTRADIARLLGYADWADYRIEPKMAKNGETAWRFLQDLKRGLEPKFRAELETLRRLKAEQTGDPQARLHSWDVSYYQNQLKKERYAIDSQALKAYFELEHTLRGMFDIFEELFGIRIQPIEAPYKWVDDLRLYLVSDRADGTPLGLIYMDLYPRQGKYNHFAQFGIVPGRRLSNGLYRRPVVALVCNFPPPSEKRPSQLTFDQVETLFHEFGHALHSVLTQARFLEFSGTSVPRDFVEAPSQMLENWVRDKKVLDRFARHYQTGEPLPADLLDRMEAARLATVGVDYRRQIAFGLLDLKIHRTTDPKVFEKVAEVTNQVIADTYLPLPQGTAMVAAFGHLGGGYDAGYYGYAWADAIAADMASVFKKAPGGLMDKQVGARLRREIYAVGGSREVEESIRAFLGRPRSLQPFFEYVGLKESRD